MKPLLLFALLLVSSFSFASAPRLVVVATDQGGYPAPALCFFSNNNMVIHPEGLLVHYTCLGGPDLSSQIWLVNERPKRIAASAFGNLLTEPTVVGTDIFILEYNEFRTVAFHQYKNGTLSTSALPETLRNAHVHDFAAVGESLFFRYTDRSNGLHGEGVYNHSFTILPERGPEFYFKPSANGEIMIQKVKVAAGEVVELRTRSNPNPVVILKNQKEDPSSPFLSLRHQFALNGKKWATIATTANGLTLIRGEGRNFTTEDLSSHFKEIQFWSPALSPTDEVVFRGKDHSSAFALWGFKDAVKRLIVGPGLEVTEGAETVVTSSRSLMYNAPVFDREGRMYIGVGLRAPDASSDFGQGIIEIR